MSDHFRTWDPRRRPETTAAWAEKQRIDRDILLLLHQLADYACFMGDLYFGDVFAAPYWDYLDPPELDSGDREFLQEGCLLIILAMAWGRLDQSNDFILSPLSTIRQRLDKLTIADARRARLLGVVRQAVGEVAAGHTCPSDELVKESAWVHREFVRGYFERMVASFEADAPGRFASS